MESTEDLATRIDAAFALLAGAQLERDGRTYYFVSEKTRREFGTDGADAK